ncbi:HPr family phosphocarrier protein [Dethiosulfatarculus sandiegensis]|uniref:HPr kinase n=1 Tax=Dethiosulfatarculus sandiegensis TaxID=1429043 RepID=A0A0D2JHB6_9BACT|nr:HPr family phosphocarrier protein [Dethiosulfatarculus sandiegensis]KIX15136.1 HPr kinase [Dethiosulfatarculus sandiegensis]
MDSKDDKQALTCELDVINKLGLHARVAARIAEVVQAHECEAILSKDNIEADASSILSILTLDAPRGSTLIAKIWGPQAAEAIKALKEQFAKGFGE